MNELYQNLKNPPLTVANIKTLKDLGFRGKVTSKNNEGVLSGVRSRLISKMRDEPDYADDEFLTTLHELEDEEFEFILENDIDVSLLTLDFDVLIEERDLERDDFLGTYEDPTELNIRFILLAVTENLEEVSKAKLLSYERKLPEIPVPGNDEEVDEMYADIFDDVKTYAYMNSIDLKPFYGNFSNGAPYFNVSKFIKSLKPKTARGKGKGKGGKVTKITTSGPYKKSMDVVFAELGPFERTAVQAMVGRGMPVREAISKNSSRLQTADAFVVRHGVIDDSILDSDFNLSMIMQVEKGLLGQKVMVLYNDKEYDNVWFEGIITNITDGSLDVEMSDFGDYTEGNIDLLDEASGKGHRAVRFASGQYRARRCKQ